MDPDHRVIKGGDCTVLRTIWTSNAFFSVMTFSRSSNLKHDISNNIQDFKLKFSA